METKSLNKTVLLVDDDPVFLKGMMYTVKQLGYNSVLAQSGRDAVEKIKQNSIDAIVSDINMPDGNGVQLLNHVKKHSNIPVVLMTGLSDLKEAQAAIEMGATSFLTKPFKKLELSIVLENCFFEEEEKKEDVQKSDMVKLHLEEFLNGQKMNFSIYLKSKEAFIKISSGGETLTPEIIRSHRDAGIEYLYVRKDEFVEYVGLRHFVGGNTSLERKHAIRDEAFHVLDKFNYLKHVNKDAFMRAQVHIESTLDILTDNEDTLALLERMKKSSGDLFFRGVEVAFLSILISQYLGTGTTSDYFTLTAGGLFHDVGLIDTDISVTDQPLHSLNANERVIMEMHPERGVKALSKIAQFPDGVKLIVEQHQENEVGTGYPNALTARFVHHLAKVVIVASSFAFNIRHKHSSVNEVHKILDEFAVASKGIYSMKSLEALLLVFNHSMPEEFVEYQLTQMLQAVEN